MKRLITCLILLVSSQAPVIAHNVYSSFTSLEWNASDNSIEAVIELHAHELEAKLSVILNERLTFLEDADYSKLEKAAAQYIPQHVQLAADGIATPLIYLGMESEGQIIRVYFEADLAKAPKRLEFMNSILLNDLPGQVNTVVARVHNERLGDEITADSGPAEFTFK
ncbi:MAG: DUF6702 family protein [Kordiimonas sp.]